MRLITLISSALLPPLVFSAVIQRRMYSGNGHGGDTDFNGQYPSDDSYISGDRSDADYHTTLSSDQTLHNTPFGTANTLNNLPATSLRSFEDLLANELQTVSPQWTQEWPQVMSKAGSLVETITQKKEVRWAKGIIDHRGVRYRPAQGERGFLFFFLFFSFPVSHLFQHIGPLFVSRFVFVAGFNLPFPATMLCALTLIPFLY